MGDMLAETPRERLIEYVRTLPEGALTLAEQALHTLDMPMRQNGETVVDPNHPQIVSRADVLGGEPVVCGTRTPVRAIVENWRMALTPGDVMSAMPHLTLAQIFGALGYYSDHQAEVNTSIERNRVPDHLLDPVIRAAQ